MHNICKHMQMYACICICIFMWTSEQYIHILFHHFRLGDFQDVYIHIHIKMSIYTSPMKVADNMWYISLCIYTSCRRLTMCTYMYTYIHICVEVYVHILCHICIYIYIYVYIYIYLDAYIHIKMCIYRCAYTHLASDSKCVYMHICVHICTHIRPPLWIM